MSRERDATEITVATLRLEPGTETISGTLADAQDDERPFWGWLELSRALDELRGADARVEDPATPLELGTEK